MINIQSLFKKASHSKFYLFILNQLLFKTIPFNAPHKVRIMETREGFLKIKYPYITKNLNHLKGLHACGLAALCEYSCGLMLLNIVQKDYRLIMKTLKMEYHFQGKKDAIVQLEFNEAELLKEIGEGLEKADSLLKTFVVEAFDVDQNKLCTATIEWQLKDWKKVRTKM